MNGYYIASWYSNKLYNAHMDPNVIVTVNGTEYKAGDLLIRHHPPMWKSGIRTM